MATPATATPLHSPGIRDDLPDDAIAGRHHRAVLLGEPRDASVARGFARSVLSGAPHSAVDRAVLATSELVTNAVINNCGRIVLELTTSRDHVVVRVRSAQTSMIAVVPLPPCCG